MSGFREAAGFEGLIVLAVVYFLLSQLQKVGKKAGRPTAPPPVRPPAAGEDGETPQERISLEGILEEIERVKRQKQPERPAAGRAPLPGPRPAMKPLPARRPPPPRRPDVIQDERGPLGRVAPTQLESAEEVEVRTSLEDLDAREVPDPLKAAAELFRKRLRPIVVADDQAETVVEHRVQEAEARNRSHTEADHRSFDQRVRAGEGSPGGARRYSVDQLRQALVWREILGPPKALEE